MLNSTELTIIHIPRNTEKGPIWENTLVTSCTKLEKFSLTRMKNMSLKAIRKIMMEWMMTHLTSASFSSWGTVAALMFYLGKMPVMSWMTTLMKK